MKLKLSHPSEYQPGRYRENITPDDSGMNTGLSSEYVTGSNNVTKVKHNNGSHSKREYSANAVVSPHLMGLKQFVKKRTKEVSPIQREENNFLLNSGTSLFDSSQSNQYGSRDLRVNQHDSNPMKIIEESDVPQTTEETKEVNCIDLSDEICSEEKDDSNASSSNSEDECKPDDENVEMERVMKMNFYKFKSNNQNGIVGMCQKVKNNRIKSPQNPKMSSVSNRKNMSKDRYSSFVNKSINS